MGAPIKDPFGCSHSESTTMLITLSVTLFALLVALHFGTIAMTLWRYLVPPRRTPRGQPFLSLIRPVCGADPIERETLGSSFALDYPQYELIFCAPHESDPSVALVKELMAQHPARPARLLIGETALTGNPKLNNLFKGVEAARSPWLVMTDSNLLLPPSYLDDLLDCWTSGVGLVSGPPVGSRPESFWAAVEAAFLNTNQARWQLAVDSLGFGFAQGKTLFWRRDLLEQTGGLVALGRELAEDVASTKAVRAQGFRVRLPRKLFAQPLGKRERNPVWHRQLRWSRLRLEGFPIFFVLELFQGALPPLLLLSAFVSMGLAPLWTLPVLCGLWFGAEWLLARLAGWPSGPRDLAAMVVRDTLFPLLWFSTWRSPTIHWRGHRVEAID